MSNETKSKYDIYNFLDMKIIDDFKKFIQQNKIQKYLVNSNNLYKYSALFNATCAFLDKTSQILKFFNEIQNINEKEYNFHLFVLYSSNIIDGIKNLESLIKKIDGKFKIKNINSSLFLKDIKEFFEEQVKIKENIDYKKLTDDIVFEFIRSISSVHPLETNKQFKKFDEHINKYIKNIVSPSIDVDEDSMYRTLMSISKDDKLKNKSDKIDVKIYSYDYYDENTKTNINNNLNKKILHFYFDFKDLKKYISNWFLEMKNIQFWLSEHINKEFILYFKKKIKKLENRDKLEILDKLIKIFQNKIDYTSTDLQTFQKEYDFFKNKEILYKQNNINIKKYFDFKFELLKKKINEINNVDDVIEWIDQIFIEEDKFIKNIIDQDKNMMYCFEKHNDYLNIDIDRNGYLPNYDNLKANDIEWGLAQTCNIYEKFANEYVYMEIYNTNLSFLEIKLLIKVALFLNNESQ